MSLQSSDHNLNTPDLQTLQLALQQQQQNLQLQLKNFLMLQQASSIDPMSNERLREKPELLTPDCDDVTTSPPGGKKLNLFPQSVPRSANSPGSPPPLTALPSSPFSHYSAHRSVSPVLIPNHAAMMGRLDLPADENLDLEELERFAKEFKQRRIKLGEFFPPFSHTLLLYLCFASQMMVPEFYNDSSLFTSPVTSGT